MNGVESASPYDDIAEWYDEWIGDQPIAEDPFVQGVEALMGEVAGMTICDLACGQGRLSRRLAERGAIVTGIDSSARMLSLARQYEAMGPQGIAYLQVDATACDGIADASFDGVVCHMALMDIPLLPPTLAHVRRILRPGGWFVFSVLHPCFNPPISDESLRDGAWWRLVRAYFDERFWQSPRRTGPPGKVGAYHRTLGTYLNACVDAGLAIERIDEPQFAGVHAQRRPIWAEVPAVLIGRCRQRG